MRRKRTLLWALATTFFLASSLTAAFPFLFPLPAQSDQTLARATIMPPPFADATSPQFEEAMLARDLRRPLYDPPPPPQPPAPAQVAKPTLQVRLTGTIVEPGYSRAMLVTADGRTELKGVGQKSGDAEILSIKDKWITVRFHGEVLELKVKSEGRG